MDAMGQCRMTLRVQVVCVVVVALAAVTRPPAARADARPEAVSMGRKLLAQGLKHYADGDFSKAIKVLRRAAAKAKDPAVLGRIHTYLGASYFVSNQRVKAEHAIIRALGHDPTVTLEVKEVGQSTVKLLNDTRRALLGVLDVKAPRAGVTLKLDGKPWGMAPKGGKVSVGSHELRMETSDGKWACEATVVVRSTAPVEGACALARVMGKLRLVTSPAGAQVRLGQQLLGRTPLEDVALPVGTHQLEVRLKDHAGVSLKVAISRQRPASHEVSLMSASAVTAAQRRRSKTIWAYSALGAGLACLAGAAVLYGVGASQGAEANEAYMSATTKEAFALHRDEVGQARAKLIGGHVLAGVGVAALGLSTYMMLTRPDAAERQGSRRADRSLGVSPVRGGAVFTFGGQY